MKKFNALCNKIIKESNEYPVHWSTPEIAECINKISEKLLAAGFEIEPKTYPGGRPSICFCKPGDHKEFFIGNYKYPFSFSINASPKYMVERKSISFTEVFKHNGAAANASIDCNVIYNGCLTPPELYKIYGKTPYAAPNWKTECKNDYTKRFKPAISDKLMDKMLAEAIAIYDTYQLKDWSKYTVPDDHPDFICADLV